MAISSVHCRAVDYPAVPIAPIANSGYVGIADRLSTGIPESEAGPLFVRSIGNDLWRARSNRIPSTLPHGPAPVYRHLLFFPVPFRRREARVVSRRSGRSVVHGFDCDGKRLFPDTAERRENDCCGLFQQGGGGAAHTLGPAQCRWHCGHDLRARDA